MLNSSIWRAVLSLFYPPVIIRGKNGKNSENPVGSNKSEKRKPKSAVYRSFWASVVYFHLRLISTKNHKGEMTRNAVVRKGTWVRIPPLPPEKPQKRLFLGLFSILLYGKLPVCCPAALLPGAGIYAPDHGWFPALKTPFVA